MAIFRGKAATTIALFLTLTVAVTLVALPATDAQANRKQTYAFIGAMPRVKQSQSSNRYFTFLFSYNLASRAFANLSSMIKTVFAQESCLVNSTSLIIISLRESIILSFEKTY